MCMVSKNLRDHFPMIRDREAVLADINGNKQLLQLFHSWEKEQQEEFLDLCTGARGFKLLYDSFFKEIINPEYSPSRLEDFLSSILKQNVKILKVLPNDSVRIAAENALLITDIVVEFENGTIANLEIQKIGYKFPGERAACYSADLLLRQYKRIRDEKKAKKEKFNYKDVKPVYTIVLFEKSPSEFKKFPDIYIHYLEQHSDTGLQINLLQKYWFIPLDIFREKQQNKAITNRTDAWLTFFSMDRPEDIIRLITAYPEFKVMYDELYHLCLNTERVMEMFSKELYEFDKNTVQYMMDEMQETIDGQKETIDEQKETIGEMRETLDTQQETIDTLQETIKNQEAELQAALKHIEELEKQKNK